MRTNQRILVELLAPTFLAVTWLTVISFKSEPILVTLAAFLPFLFFAYFFSFIPSLMYTLLMEIWFRSGLRRTFGFLCTVGLSALLGAGAGFVVGMFGTWLGLLFLPDCIYFSRVGAVVGLLVGLYVSKEQTSAV